MSASSRAVLSAVAAAVLAVAAYLSHVAADVVVGLLLLAFAIGWPRLVSLPAVGRRTVLLALVAVAGAVAVIQGGNLRYLTVVTAAGVIGAFLVELARSDGRPRLVESLAASATGIVVIASGVGWLAMGDSALSIAVVLTTAGTLAAGAACAAIHLPPWPHAILTIVGATAVGAVAAVALPEISFVGGLIGFASGLLSAALHQLLGRYPAAGRLAPALAAAALPVIVVGVPVYSLVRFYLT